MVFSSRSITTLVYMARFKVTARRMAITASPQQGQYLRCSPYSSYSPSPNYTPTSPAYEPTGYDLTNSPGDVEDVEEEQDEQDVEDEQHEQHVEDEQQAEDSPMYEISPVVSPIRDFGPTVWLGYDPTSPSYSPTVSALRITSSWSDLPLVARKKIAKRKNNKFDRTIPIRYSARRRIPVVPYSP